MTGLFWMDAAERAVGNAASAALATIGTGAIGLFDVAWPTIGSMAGMAAVAALLVSVVAGTTGDPTTAGFATDSRAATRKPYPM
ncbi:holin [Nonomuraea sp. NPDC059194]|uniref:holin n=1 Tax=Nonomuraea sp. NPDC059194 TaxID=3346764 RepID=UPI0036946070